MRTRQGEGLPYWRLSVFYLFYFGALGVLVPYWGLFLQSRGFDALAIGQLMAILVGTKVVAPMIWGHLVDTSGRRMPLVRLAALATVLVFGIVFVAVGFWPMALAMVLFSFFWNASLPQLEAVTFNHLGPQVVGYARIRLWGSVGFIVTVSIVGLQLESASLSVVPIWVGVIFVGIWLSTLVVPDSAPARHSVEMPSLWGLVSRVEVQAFLAACFLMQLGHGPFYTFYSIHLEAAGYSSTAVGMLWSWGVVAEVVAFVVMHRLLLRFGARRVLLWSLGVAVVRWSLIGAFVEQVVLQALAQTMHAATFGTFHAAAIHLVHHYFPGRTQGRGQALYSSLSFGAGVALGSLLGGVLWEDPGPMSAFGLSAVASALGFVAVWRWVDPQRRF